MLRFNLNRDITTTGILGDDFNISDEISCRFVIEGASGSNVILVSGKITGQTGFVLLGTLTGSVNQVISVETYDLIKIECTTYGSTGSSVKVLGCSFNT